MTNGLVLKRLYRSLLKASKPFSPPSQNAAVLSSLLHRTGIDDGLDLERLLARIAESSHQEETRTPKSLEEARDLSRTYAQDDTSDNNNNNNNNNNDNSKSMRTALEERRAPYRVLFRRLLRQVIAGDGARHMQFPGQVDTTRLASVLQREFRCGKDAISNHPYFDKDNTRQQVAFHALRELNKKLSWMEQLQERLPHPDDALLRNTRQAAKGVVPLPLNPDFYLKAGTFLIAHPLLTGYFRRSVVCILHHSETGGTYGLIVNRIGVSPSTGRDRTLRDVLRTMPPQLSDVFGECSVRDGGPVHMSIQMIHSTTDHLGGTVLSSVPEEPIHTDRAIYYQGDIVQAAQAVNNGELDRDDVCFYVGASCWEVRQLDSEMERGFWLPCRGPPQIALTGTCEHVGDHDTEGERPRADLWLSMMCAMGQEEATLAHLVVDDDNEDGYDECQLASDAF